MDRGARATAGGARMLPRLSPRHDGVASLQLPRRSGHARRLHHRVRARRQPGRRTRRARHALSLPLRRESSPAHVRRILGDRNLRGIRARSSARAPRPAAHGVVGSVRERRHSDRHLRARTHVSGRSVRCSVLASRGDRNAPVLVVLDGRDRAIRSAKRQAADRDDLGGGDSGRRRRRTSRRARWNRLLRRHAPSDSRALPCGGGNLRAAHRLER